MKTHETKSRAVVPELTRMARGGLRGRIPPRGDALGSGALQLSAFVLAYRWVMDFDWLSLGTVVATLALSTVPEL